MRPARLAAHFALAAAAAWALAQGTTSAERAAAPANRAPELALPAGGVLVRAGESASVVVEALDPDILADGAPEAVWLGVELRSGSHAPPPWLARTAWSAGPSERPRLELGIAPPFDAAPGSFTVEAGATDSRGLSALARFGVTVLPPRCGPLEIDEDGTCVRCPENRLPDGSRSFCEPCPVGTERPVGAPSCAACAAGLSSEAGGACGCGPAGVLDEGRCAECPPH
ncbi:MAG: hypothetical protein OXP11_00895, partial [Gammaproteobacteria bacterium]|nr:hypothetical protein [Gammaproteobacteria bacterium]